VCLNLWNNLPEPHTKFELKPSKQSRRLEGSHCQANPVAPDLQNQWHRFWAVYIFHYAGASPEIMEIFPEIPNFSKTPEKSPEYPDFADKIVLSDDFQDSPIHPPLGDIKILSKIQHQDVFILIFF
jgi:hypothetical protein